MDFITKLPLSRNFDSILVVVDRFSKMAIFTPTYSAITPLDLAQLFISHVFSKNGLPISIVSDRGYYLFHNFGLNCVSSSRYQDIFQLPFTLKQMYRQRGTFINKTVTILTIYGGNPSFDSIHISQDTPAGKLSTKLQLVQQVFKEELESEVKRFKKYADRNRAIPPDFQPGDKVWLASKNINTGRPTKHLSEIWLGPFEVLKKIGSHAYHLKLPAQWKSVHPVFHVSLLEPVKQSTIPNQHQLPPLPVIVEEQEEWEVA
ncbi:hypothetical protein O181_110188 [Austropuccinia psidii MF-1]|uniref:Integrase catalytic domain-containing protein n=1 Tax=Austropuccinia psidii MF-1 TaxID=1389203 RepID=A0A9Q3JW57_9BASI|nr:hypothetical protein [Austropuccinia psidii MF-1]